jgi:hypothetical protein
VNRDPFIKHQQCFKNKLPLLFVSFWVFFFLKNGTCHGSDLDGCLEAFTQNTASFKKWFTLGNLSYLSEWKKVFMFLTIPSRTKVHLYQVYQNVK